MIQKFYSEQTGLFSTVETLANGGMMVEVYDLAAPVLATPASVPGMDEFPLVKAQPFPAGMVAVALHYARSFILDRDFLTDETL